MNRIHAMWVLRWKSFRCSIRRSFLLFLGSYSSKRMSSALRFAPAILQLCFRRGVLHSSSFLLAAADRRQQRTPLRKSWDIVDKAKIGRSRSRIVGYLCRAYNRFRTKWNPNATSYCWSKQFIRFCFMDEFISFLRVDSEPWAGFHNEAIFPTPPNSFFLSLIPAKRAVWLSVCLAECFSGTNSKLIHRTIERHGRQHIFY